MDRRKFLGAAAGTAAGLGLELGQGRAAGRPPNLIIILADDLGWGDLGCQGSQAIATPNVDRLAAEGVRLTGFHASGPVCSPSRAGLLTGRYPARAGVNFVFIPKELLPALGAYYPYYRMPLGLPTSEITLAEALKSAGYATCCIGKWHLGDFSRYLPTSRGFDHYFGVLHSNDAVPLRLYRDREVVEPAPVDQDQLTQKYAEEAVAWIAEQDGPFFLYFAHTFPHIPLHASAEFRGRSAGGLYGDAVEEIDWSVGEVMRALEARGVADDTFVFFTSDNGPWFEGSAGPYRGRKGQTLEGGMRVPGIARWPAGLPAGAVRDGMGMNFDLFATGLALAGLDPPADRPIDGRDLLPLLRGEAGSPHDALFFYRGRHLEAVLTGRWKYHRVHKGWTELASYLPPRPVLIDLESDPTESYNAIDLYPEVAAELEASMREWERNFKTGAPKARGVVRS